MIAISLPRWRGALMALALGVASPAVAAPEPAFPALTGRVVDDAGILSPQTEALLDARLADFEAATQRQVVIATLRDLQGYPIEDYGYRLGRAWGIGEKGKNTGAILIVAPKERAVRIEVGYGLEGELTDAASSAIVQQTILPAFRAGNFDAGVVAGTNAILHALGWRDGATPRTSPAAPDSGVSFSGLAFFAIFVLFWLLRRRRGRRSGIWRSAGWGGIGGAMGGFGTGRGFGGFGGTGGGGFRGGGGSFGGGGASGRW